MKLFPKLRLLSVVFAIALTLTTCREDDTPTAKTIVDVALADQQLWRFMTALEKAELVRTFKSAGPFTVFAPTDAAFMAAGMADLSQFSKADLTQILMNHVLYARMPTASVTSGEATTAGGTKIYLLKNANGVFINNNIRVITPDVSASNGVIHVIDKVIVPPFQNIVQLAQDNTNLKTLVSLMKQADLGALLSSSGPYTLFAPTDAAFTELFKTVNPASLTKAQLTNILLYHVVPGRLFSTNLANGEVQTLNMTDNLTIAVAGGAVTVAGKTSGAASKVTKANTLGTNGVIHEIDKVLLP